MSSCRATNAKAHQVSETDIKKAITDALEAAGYIVTRTAAGGYRGRTKGCKTGTPDLHVIGSWGRSCWLEVKATKKDKATKEQEKFMEEARRKGAYAAVVRSADDALGTMHKAGVAFECKPGWVYDGADWE